MLYTCVIFNGGIAAQYRDARRDVRSLIPLVKVVIIRVSI